MATAVLKRVARRETHSPRTVAAVIALAAVALAAVYAGVEIVLHLLGQPPLLVGPHAALTWIADLPRAQPQPAVIAGAVVVGLLGLWLLVLAITPGRRSKHELDVAAPNMVVVDNGVIASAVAEHVRRELDLARNDVVVGVSHRGVDVTVRADPGREVDTADVRAAAQSELAGYRATPSLKVRARVQYRDEPGGAL